MLKLSNIVIAMQNRLNRVFMISPETNLDDFSYRIYYPAHLAPVKAVHVLNSIDIDLSTSLEFSLRFQ